MMDIIAREPIGLVLLDLTMPHLSGEALLEQIAQEYPDIGVIIISGLNQLETAVHCIRLGAYDYFVKTTEENRLIEGIRRAIRIRITSYNVCYTKLLRFAWHLWFKQQESLRRWPARARPVR